LLRHKGTFCVTWRMDRTRQAVHV